jgi:death on curing protein
MATSREELRIAASAELRDEQVGARRRLGGVSDPVEFLGVDDLIDLARGRLGDPPPIRDVGLLGSAAARPQMSVGAEDAYPDLWTKAGARLQSIVNIHALVDGNKLLGWLGTAVFLELDRARPTMASNDELYDLVMSVAAGDPPLDDIAAALRRLTGPPR